jgi:shikimate dehydrogenase
MVSGSTKVCCLIGDPVEHSLSPLIHNAGYQALGIDFIYIPFRVSDLKPAMEAIRTLGIRGVSITVPHKVAALQYLDNIDDEAREIGAVNTIVNDNGVLTGYNTDGTGARQALEAVTALSGKKAILVGSGGAALAIATALQKKGTKLVILNRTVEKARHLAKLTNADDFGGLDKLTAVSSIDILINATSVGMWPGRNESVIPREQLHDGLIVFDIVYNPKETRLLTEAREKGCTVVYGYRMLLYQAARQFELFTGHQAPLPVMERALIEALG